MSTRILPIEAVISQTGLSRRTVYDEVAAGRFPRPIQLTARRVGWPETDIQNWIERKIAARDGVAA